MPSSTSSSELGLPKLRWGVILGVSALVLLVGIKALESGLRMKGFRAGALDSESLWLKQRARADALGSRALVLVGDSRMQLDIDQDVLRQETGLEPVQLAIDATPYLGVLRGLAEDPHITGTVLVDFSPAPLLDEASFRQPSQYELDAERSRPAAGLPTFTDMDARLTDWLRGALRSYADGGQPLTALTQRLLPPHATPQYLVTLPDRSTLADYSLVMPDAYYRRVFRNLGISTAPLVGVRTAALDAWLDHTIAGLQSADDRFFLTHVHEIAALAAKIEARGGRVIFAVFPESGHIKKIDDRVYPRQHFWDPFAAGIGVPALHFEDDPALRRFVCPDGSHLDFRQRAGFTDALVRALHLDATPPDRR